MRDDLQAVGAALLDVADPRADLGRRAGPALADDRVDQDARRDDRVRVALGLPPLGLVEVAADLARRRDAGREIQVALVLDRLRHAGLALFVPVHVRVDDAGHHVLAGGVDHGVGAARGRGCRRRADVRDEAVLDDDVDRAERRLGVAVDHHRVADDAAAAAPCACSDGVGGGCWAASAEGQQRRERDGRGTSARANVGRHAAAAPRWKSRIIASE